MKRRKNEDFKRLVDNSKDCGNDDSDLEREHQTPSASEFSRKKTPENTLPDILDDDDESDLEPPPPPPQYDFVEPFKKVFSDDLLNRLRKPLISTNVEEDNATEDFETSDTERKEENIGNIAGTPDSIQPTDGVAVNDGIIRKSSAKEMEMLITEYETETITKFNVVQTTKDFWKESTLNQFLTSGEKFKIRWELNKDRDTLQIPFNGTPFIIVGKRSFQCHQGKDLNVKKKENFRKKQTELMNEHFIGKRRKLAQDTKKKGCPVVFNVKKLFSFPTFQITKDSRFNRDQSSKRLKKFFSKIREDSTQLQQSSYFLEFLVRFPTEKHQFHNIGIAAGLIEPLDDRISQFIKKLIRGGCRRVKELESRALDYVKNDLFDGESNPSVYRSRFFPERRKIRNLITFVKVESRYSKMDQENVEHFISRCTNARIKFVPRSSEIPKEEMLSVKEEDDNDDCEFDPVPNEIVERKMMFIYQSDEMKYLYRRYCPTLALLDATYRTTKYSLPLYFLVCQTNVNYQPVAVIVCQEETAEMITQALQTIKDWNPDTVPKYGMVDFDHGEILALETVYPGIMVFICDFHREQAWHRWIAKRENGVFDVAEHVKARLRRIANSITREELNEALDDLRQWNRFQGKLKAWFEGTWFPEIERWCLFYRPNDLMNCNTNNGTERINGDLKHDELEEYGNCSLSEMLEIVIGKFLPKLYRKYVALNVKFSSGYKTYTSGIPKFLNDRPRSLVVHLLDRIWKVTTQMTDSVEELADGSFKVKSDEAGVSDDERMYVVSFGDETETCSCTCRDFRRTRLLCKHFFAILQSNKRTFFDISPIFIDHPFTNLDEKLFNNPNTGELNTNEQNAVGEGDGVDGDDDNSSGGDNVFEDNDDGNDDDNDNEVHSSNRKKFQKFKAKTSSINDLFARRRGNKTVLKRNLIAKVKFLNELCHNITDSERIEQATTQVEETISIMKTLVDTNKFVNDNTQQMDTPKNTNPTKFRSLPVRKRKHYYSGRVGKKAEMMRQLHQAKLLISSPKQHQIETEVITMPCDAVYTNPEDLDVQEITIESKPEIIEVMSDGIDDTQSPVGSIEAMIIGEVTEKAIKILRVEDKELNDDVINLAQIHLRKQHTGFQDTGVKRFKPFSGTFIQLLLVKNNHWICVKGLPEKNEVQVFDSLVSTLSMSTLHTIASMLKTKNEEFLVHYKSVQQQNNHIDCGLFAVAFATDIVNGIDPCKSNYNTTQFRKHLKVCFENEEMTPFPQKSNNRVPRCKDKFETFEVFCVCRDVFFEKETKKDDTLFMAECSNCGEWYHRKCVGIPLDVFYGKNVNWECNLCELVDDPVSE